LITQFPSTGAPAAHTVLLFVTRDKKPCIKRGGGVQNQSMQRYILFTKEKWPHACSGGQCTLINSNGT